MNWRPERILFAAFLLASTSKCEEDFDFTIAGLYTIHAQLNCDTLQADHVILSEAHRFAVEYANYKILAPVGLRMGSTLGDTCDDRSITLQETVNQIKTTKGGFCQTQPTREDFSSTMIAMVGSFNCDLAENIDYLLQAFCIPVISALCTSTQLDDHQLFPYFARTAASDMYRAQIMYDVIMSQQWFHIAVIADSSTFGEGLKAQFNNMLFYCTMSLPKIDLKVFRPPCIEKAFDIDFKNTAKSTAQLKELRDFLKESAVRVLMIFVDPAFIDFLMLKIESFGFKRGDIQFVLPTTAVNSSSWDILQYAFAVEPYVAPVPEFEARLKNTTISDTTNEFLAELIQFDNICCAAGNDDCPFSIPCKGNEVLRRIPPIGLRRARLVIDAVSLIAHTVLRMHSDLCEQSGRICDNFLKHFTGKLFLDNLLAAEFPSIGTKDTFRTFQGSGQPVYDILQQQGVDRGWVRVLGKYNPLVGPMADRDNREPQRITVYEEIREETESCQATCVKEVVDYGKGCCWNCRSCPEFSYINNTNQRCTACPSDLIPTENLDGCKKPFDEGRIYMEPTGEMNAIIVLNAFGVCLTVPAVAFLHWRRRTPMVRAATPDLAYQQAIAVSGLFILSALMIPSSAAAVCGSVWALSALLLAACHSVFLSKALRISRPDFFVRLISTAKTPIRASAAINILMVFVQVFIVMIWLILRPPDIQWDRRTGTPSCSSNNEAQTIILLINPVFLVISTLVFQKRACANQYIYQVHQARIGLAGSLCFLVNYGVLLALVVIEESTEQVKAIILMCIPMITGYISWVTMLLPTTYEVLTKAKQNDQEYVTRQRSRQFQEGNVMYYVESVVFNRPKGHTVNTIDSAVNSVAEK